MNNYLVGLLQGIPWYYNISKYWNIVLWFSYGTFVWAKKIILNFVLQNVVNIFIRNSLFGLHYKATL